MSNKTKVIIFISSCFFFLACTNNNGPHHYKAMNLSNKSKDYVKGANDGCSTAEGHYTKNHSAFNNNSAYNEGWWAGRRNCEDN